MVFALVGRPRCVYTVRSNVESMVMATYEAQDSPLLFFKLGLMNAKNERYNQVSEEIVGKIIWKCD